jgi:uncharacterized DUF497 family protein
MKSDGTSAFDWDSDNIGHIGRHGVTQEEFEQVMQNSPIYTGTQIDERSGEERYREIGHTDACQVLIAIWTDRRNLCRAVTAYRATRPDREGYFKQKGMVI